MDESFLLAIKNIHEYDEDDKHACMSCSKPVRVLYEVQLANGLVVLLCGSDKERQLKLAARARRMQNGTAQPSANGTSRIS